MADPAIVDKPRKAIQKVSDALTNLGVGLPDLSPKRPGGKASTTSEQTSPPDMVWNPETGKPESRKKPLRSRMGY